MNEKPTRHIYLSWLREYEAAKIENFLNDYKYKEE
jgi:hypothetical protein